MASRDPFALALMYQYTEGDIPDGIRRSHETIGEASKRKRGIDACSGSQAKVSRGGGDDSSGEEIPWVRLQFLAPRSRNQITNQVCEQFDDKKNVVLFVMPAILPDIVTSHAFSPSAMPFLITINRHTSPFTTMITTSEIHPNNRYVVHRFDRYSATATLGSMAVLTTSPLRQFLQHVHFVSAQFAASRQMRVVVFASPAAAVRPCDILLHTIAAVHELIIQTRDTPGMVTIAIDQAATALVAFAMGSTQEREAPIASMQLAEAISDRLLPRLLDGAMMTPDGIQTVQARRHISEIGAVLGSMVSSTEPIRFCFMSQPVPKLPLDGFAIVTLDDYLDTGNIY